MKTMELFKQFVFGTVFFVTCVSIHWNFAGTNAQKNIVYQQKATTQEKIQEVEVMREKLALNQMSKTAKL